MSTLAHVNVDIVWPSRSRCFVVTQSVVVIGETVADAFVVASSASGLDLQVRPGGSPANTAVALGRLGTPTRFVGRLSRGALGESLLAHVAGSRVDVSGCVRSDAPATLAIASLDAAGRASYELYVNGTADWSWTADELGAIDAACVHTGSLALVLPPGGPLIEAALAAARSRSTISIDPNARPALVSAAVYQARLPIWMGLADILRVSDEDLAYLMPGASIERAFDTWHEAGVALGIVTLGAGGAVASLRGARVAVPAIAVEVVDTVGAGDSFTAGVLHSLAAGDHLGGRLAGVDLAAVERAIRHGVRVAACTCQVRGADPPWADQVPCE
jgi:fructokinase